jgi:hypothetical protein
MTASRRGVVRREAQITREMVRANPHVIYVFGDNLMRLGFGGQARAMRGEPNTIGVPTKWSPSRAPAAYFSDNDPHQRIANEAINVAFDELEQLLAAGYDVVIPTAGLGTGRAELDARAPEVFRLIQSRIARLTGESAPQEDHG